MSDFNDEEYAASRGITLMYLNMGMTKKGIDKWPCGGTKMRFLNENGYDSERKYAATIFNTENVYEIESVSIGQFSSNYTFVGIEGSFNTVMFKPLNTEEL